MTCSQVLVGRASTPARADAMPTLPDEHAELHFLLGGHTRGDPLSAKWLAYCSLLTAIQKRCLRGRLFSGGVGSRVIKLEGGGIVSYGDTAIREIRATRAFNAINAILRY